MNNELKAQLVEHKKAVEVMIGVLLLLTCLLVASQRWLDPVECLTLDLRFALRGARQTGAPVRVVAVDEKSLDHPESGAWPWSRYQHAKFLYSLDESNLRPRVTGYDFLFQTVSPSGDAMEDESFVTQLKESRHEIVLPYLLERGFASRFEKQSESLKLLKASSLAADPDVTKNIPEYSRVSAPFLKASREAPLGFANLARDRQGRTRMLPLVARLEGRPVPSFVLKVLAGYLGASPRQISIEKNLITVAGKQGARSIPVSDEGTMLLNYDGRLSGVFPVFSFIDVLLADRQWQRPGTREMVQQLRGNIVLAGQTATSLEEGHTTPFYENEPGIFLYAQALANILEERYLRRAPLVVSLAALAGMGLLVILLVEIFPVTRALPSVLGLSLVYFIFAHILFLGGWWIDIAMPVLAALIVFTAMTSFRYFTALEELKLAQAQVVHSTKMAAMGQISAGMAHEFRNILHAIHLHIEGINRPNVSPDRIRRYMGVIEGILDNANLILNGLLTFARKSESLRKPGNLKETIGKTLLLVKKELQYQQIEVKSELDEVPPVDYDEGQISQVIMNLLNNSRDALKDRPNKLVLIRLKQEKGGVRIDLGDNGPGIPDKVMKRLFEPFVTSKEAGKGTGLGLSVCHGIMRNHGGDITVTSVAGEGTVWHLHFPGGLS